MRSSHKILINAPLNKVFLAVSDIARWPEYLPHYRFNRFLAHSPSGGTVKMSYVRLGFPLTWVSQYTIDTAKRKLRFRHLKGALNATQGMDILWNFREVDDGTVEVRVDYFFNPRLPIIGPALADWLVGGFFIKDLARKSLTGLKRKLEAQSKISEPVLLPDPEQKVPVVKRRTSRRRFSRRAKPQAAV